MSSILDALRKLEEEKAQHPAAPPVAPRPIERSAREPAPRRSRSHRPARSRRHTQDNSRKLWIAVPVVIFALGIIWAATTSTSQSDSLVGEQELVVAASATPAAVAEPDQGNDPVLGETTLDRIEADLRVAAEEPLRETELSIRKASLAAPIQSAKPEPEPVQTEPAAPIVVPESPPVQVIETPADADPESDITAASIAPIQVDMSPVPMEVEPEPEILPVVEPPEEVDPEPIEKAQVQAEPIEQEPEAYKEVVVPPRTEPSERYRKAMAVSDALRDGTPLEEDPKVEEDIRRYGIMTRTVRARFGIPELHINMLMQPNERNPEPSALIDYNKVYVGEAIPGTEGRAHLIGVDIRGVAIEVNGERFYYPK